MTCKILTKEEASLSIGFRIVYKLGSDQIQFSKDYADVMIFHSNSCQIIDWRHFALF